LRTLLIYLAVFGITGCVSINTVSYPLGSDNIETPIHLILVADLHSTIHGRNQDVLIKKILDAKPDVILLAGDIIDDRAPIRGTQMLLEGIKDSAPIYYVTGNHEYMHKNFPGIMEVLKSYGVRILSDEYERIEIRGNPVIIAGVEDPYRGRYREYDPDEAMGQAFTELELLPGYKILIAHRPERIKQYKEYAFDLVVSGHAHGGQVRIPLLLNGLYAPNQGFFPKYAGGLYTHDRLSHIVSRGLSINFWLPRIFNPPELVYIAVTPNEQ
jgi:predicted MPP superfamily phosphohydrolase